MVFILLLPDTPLMKSPLSITALVHTVLKAIIPTGALTVDATAGNGHDTLFLAQCCGQAGKVRAFDVQAPAVQATLARLQQARERGGMLAPCHVQQASHALMGDLLPQEWQGRVAAILFNLGYLPGGDKSLITRPESTLTALDAAAKFLAPGGILSVVAYPGHPGGGGEAKQILAWAETLDPRKWEALRANSLQRADSPFLLLLRCHSEKPKFS